MVEGESGELGMGTLWWWTTLAITVSTLLGDIADSFDGGTQPKQQLTLCGELILPAGYPCSEYMVLLVLLTLSLSLLPIPSFNSIQ